MRPGRDEHLGESVRSLEELVNHPPVLMDGGMGTAIQALGLAAGAPPETWNLKHPEEVRSISEGYASAGSQIVLTNTFGANRARLEKYSLQDEVHRLNVQGALLAAEGAAGRALVAGSIGPSGLCTGIDPPKSEMLKSVFAEQCGALRDGGVDLLALETFYDMLEFRAALAAASGCGLPYIACMTFQETPRGFFTMMGVKPSEAVKEAREFGAAAAGANCTLGSDAMARLAGELAAIGAGPVAVSPNAGMPELVGGRTVYRQRPEEFASDMMEAIRAGADLVGGCCGTTPAFIRELAENIRGGT